MMFDSIDFKNCELLYREDSEPEKEDLLQLKCPNGRLIDVGWYGQNNQYCIMVIQDARWERPCYQIRGVPRIGYVERHLQKIIDFETAVFASRVQSLLDEITGIIDQNPPVTDTCGDAVQRLEQLRDEGLPKQEAADYIEVYALQYRESDEEKWDFACDLLDRVTGWCSPDLRIWKD